jgi:Domain of unknown function (DUF1905)
MQEIMKSRASVEPPEPVRGLEVPQGVVEALGGGKRPRVTITINGHSWKSRVAIMRGRNLLSLSNANRHPPGRQSQLQHVRAIESAKKPETCIRRIERALER